MSVDVSDWVWRNGPRNGSDRLVLLAIADRANDAGEAFPSMADIADRSCMTERGARKIVRRLEGDGWIKTSVGGGRGGRSNYTVLMIENPEQPDRVMDVKTRNEGALNPEPECKNPEPGSPYKPENPEPETRNTDANPEPRGQNPEPECTKPGTVVPPNRQGTVKEPSLFKLDRDTIRDQLERFATPAAVTSFIAYRRRQKGKALTKTAAVRQANQLQIISERGGDPDDALGMAEERGWASVQAEWYFKAKGAHHDNRSNHNHGSRSDQRQSGASDGFAAVAARYRDQQAGPS